MLGPSPNYVRQGSQGYAAVKTPKPQRLNTTKDHFLHAQNPLQIQATLHDIVLHVLTKHSLLPQSYVTSTATCATKIAAIRKERDGIS